MSEKAITLPDRDEMLRRLKRINPDNYVAEKLFPLILKSAGQEMTGAGLVHELTLAFFIYTENLPATMRRAMWASTPTYVKTLIDDEDARAEALQAFAEAREIMRGL
jgi:hypothetical protein